MIVTDSSDAAAIENVLVSASGRKSRPLSPVRTKTGRKLTVMISSEKKRLGPTSVAASVMSRRADRGR